LIVFVIVFGAGLGWIVRQAHIQRDAVVAIEQAGGTVSYNWEWNYGKSFPRGVPWVSSRLVEFTGVDFFGHVTAVESSRNTDTTLTEIRRLNQLQRLWLNDAFLTDAGLVHLKGLTNLSDLWLDGTQVTDAGLVHLKGLTKLSALNLNGTQVTDAGLVHLKGLKKLSRLWLIDTRVTDAGLMHLKGLTKLSTLGLYGGRVTDAGVDELKRSLPSLEISR
jgi:Leucine-rich repeat (LRR) protein